MMEGTPPEWKQFKRVPPEMHLPLPPPQPPIAWLLPAIILKILRERPLHGYQIASELSKMIGHEVPRPMIYMTLRKMEERDLVTSRWETTEKGPARRIYYITDEGVEFLSRTLKELELFKKLLNTLTK